MQSKHLGRILARKWPYKPKAQLDRLGGSCGVRCKGSSDAQKRRERYLTWKSEVLEFYS